MMGRMGPGGNLEIGYSTGRGSQTKLENWIWDLDLRAVRNTETGGFGRLKGKDPREECSRHGWVEKLYVV